MKKLFMFAAVAAVALASCSKEEIVSSDVNTVNNAITFGTYATTQTKAIIDNTTGFETTYGPDGFNVDGYVSTTGFDSKYMNAQITYTTPNWGYENSEEVAYWPTSGSTLDFYAYAPRTATGASFSSSKADGLSIVYTAPTEIADQADIMYASAYDLIKTRDEAIADNKVNLLFKHALTQLKFKGISGVNGLYVDVAVNGIKIHNLPNVGTFTVPSTDVAASWTMDATAPTVTYPTVSDEVLGIYQTATNIAVDSAILVIPNEFAHWPVYTEDEIAAGAIQEDATAQEGAYLTIECRAYILDSVSGVKEYLFGTESAYSTAYVSFDDAGVWAPGKIVTYTLNFNTVGDDEEGIDNLIRIDFTAEAADWTNVGEDIIM